MIDSIISLSPQMGSSGEESRETKVQHIIKELMEKLPDELDMQEVMDKVRPQDQNPLKIVLIQEISLVPEINSFPR